LIAVFRWFGNSGAMQLEAPEDHVRVPGLTLEDARALVRLGIKRRACRRPLGDRGPEAPSPAPAVAAPAAPAFPLVEPAGAAAPAPARALVGPPAAAFPEKAFAPFPGPRSEPVGPVGPPAPAKPAPSAPRTLYRVFRKGRMWFMDPRTKKIIGEAPL
jgi:hypothetical protein